ncbi:hypothetical protein J3R83DRAFT_38 [Lanmaoa asiatica]|nr:hypothetical protein J3R83DRAFT_38 [Lanmaoa asiatica]
MSVAIDNNPKPDPSPFSSVAITGNSTLLRRLAVLAAIKTLKHFRPRCGAVLFLKMKYASSTGLGSKYSEASTLQFTAKYTSIPVPKVHCAFVRNGCAYIVMERINGDKLSRGWLSRSAESKAKILAQLKKMVDEMRGLAAPNPVSLM